MPDKNWSLLGSEILREYPTVRVREDRYRLAPTGAEAGFVVCDSADWVLVIPVTADGDVVFVRQFRHGRRTVVLEIPGGVMEIGEAPSETAARELQEETGYVAGQIALYGPLLPNPALNTACCHIAVATGCFPSAAPNPDPFEESRVEATCGSGTDDRIRRGAKYSPLTS